MAKKKPRKFQERNIRVYDPGKETYTEEYSSNFNFFDRNGKQLRGQRKAEALTRNGNLRCGYSISAKSGSKGVRKGKKYIVGYAG